MRELILNIGRREFYPALFDLARQQFSVSQVTVMRFGAGRTVDIFSVQTVDTVPKAEPFVDLYTRSYYQRDPLRDLQLPSLSREICAKTITATEIDDTDYRERLFSSAGFVSKMSIIERMPDHALAVSFYRGREAGKFSSSDVTAITNQQSVLTAIVRRHLMIENRRKPDIRSLTETIIGLKASKPLSNREAFVCAGVVLGYSNEALSLELDISIHSVITYRRRAYAKLNITSQNELFVMLIGEQRLQNWRGQTH